MKRIIIFLIVVIWGSCKKHEKNTEYLTRSLNFIEMNNTIFDNSRINILRIPNKAKNIAFEYRKYNEPGFAVFEIKPQIRLIKNLTNSRVDSIVLFKIDTLIQDLGFPILLDIKNRNILLKFKVKDTIYTFIKGNSNFETGKIKNQNYTDFVNRWKVNKQKYECR